MTIEGLKIGKGGTKSINKKLPVTGSVPVNVVASQGTLTVDTQPTADDTFTIGITTYTFKATQSAVGEIAIGEDLAESQANIVSAINGTDDYNGANFFVTAADFAANDCVLTSKRAGAAGNTTATTETFTAGTNVFDAATLGTTTAGAGTAEDARAKAGDMRTDGDYLYICLTAGGLLWKRVALSALA